jgi:hypothetical protein
MVRELVQQPVKELESVRKAWNYPLFQAIFNRRARRFPLGAEMPGGVAPFKSNKEPVPLDEIEEALLVMVGTGLSGLNLSDLPFSDAGGNSLCGNTIIQFAGRTYASPCSSHGTELFFTNDEGTYMVKMKDALPEKIAEYETEDDWDKIVQAFRANTIKLSDERLNIPMVTGVTLPFNQWNVNKPGTTLFMPISDVTWEYINIMMLVMDDPTRYYIYDDMNGNAEPLKKYADKGLLYKGMPYPLSSIESLSALAITGAEQPLMLQNMYLAAQAIGLGAWIFSSTPGPVVMGGSPLTPGLGFRFHQTEKQGPRQRPEWVGPGMGNPVGLDGVFEAYCPPNYPSMSDAVQAIYDAKWGEQGIYTKGPAAVKNKQSLDLNVPKTSEWCLEATKDLCEYIWDTYGRFPATMDAMQMHIWFQAHHLETDFYDKYYQPGAYHETIARHWDDWHSGERPRVLEEAAATA